MKNNFKNITSKVFLMGAVCLLLIASCKKADLGTPFQRPGAAAKKNPVPLVIPTATVTTTETSTVTTTETNTVTTTETNTVTTTETSTVTTTNTETPSEGSVFCPAVSYPIWAGAGQNDTTKATKVGSVSYSNDGTNLYVTATFSGPTCPTEIQLWAGSNPLAVSGNGGLPFGQFPYKLGSTTCGTYTFTVPLASLFPSSTTVCGKDVYIVLHAAMGDTIIDGTTTAGQTAIGYGSQTFGGSRWGWIATYHICCPS